MLAYGPGVSQMFSAGYQHRSTEVRAQDCIQPSWTRCGAMGAAQTSVVSSLKYKCTKSTAAKATPIQDCGVTYCLIRLSVGAELTKPVAGV